MELINFSLSVFRKIKQQPFSKYLRKVIQFSWQFLLFWQHSSTTDFSVIFVVSFFLCWSGHRSCVVYQRLKFLFYPHKIIRTMQSVYLLISLSYNFYNILISFSILTGYNCVVNGVRKLNLFRSKYYFIDFRWSAFH